MGLPPTAHPETYSNSPRQTNLTPKHIFPSDVLFSESLKGCQFLSTSLNVSAGYARLSTIWLVPFLQRQVPLGYSHWPHSLMITASHQPSGSSQLPLLNILHFSLYELKPNPQCKAQSWCSLLQEFLSSGLKHPWLHNLLYYIPFRSHCYI